MRFPLLRRALPAALATLLVLRPASSHAQLEPVPSRPPGYAGHVAAIGGNVLLGGLTAGALQALRGGSFQDGFARGALGGAVVYVGKRVAVERFDGAGLLGREVAAVGSSVVWNAAAGRGSLARILLPVGPAHLYVEPGARRPVRLEVEAVALGATLYAATRPELRFDFGASLSSGAAVFRADGHTFGIYEGMAFPGTILVSASAGARTEAAFAHERVHVLQADQVFLALSRPAQEALAAALPGVRPLDRFLDVNVAAAAFDLLGRVAEHDDRPWEAEAIFLEGR